MVGICSMCYKANRAIHKKRLQARHENAACVSKLNSVFCSLSRKNKRYWSNTHGTKQQSKHFQKNSTNMKLVWLLLPTFLFPLKKKRKKTCACDLKKIQSGKITPCMSCVCKLNHSHLVFFHEKKNANEVTRAAHETAGNA